jgi:hypothetical protein
MPILIPLQKKHSPTWSCRRFGIAALLAGGILLFTTCTEQLPTETTGNQDGASVTIADLSATPTIAPLGGVVKIRARVVDGRQQPLSGKVVQFSTTRGSITKTDTTDTSGIATATLTSLNAEGEVQITAQLNGTQTQKQVKINVDAAVQRSMSVYPQDPVLLADGVTKTEIIVELQSGGGQSLSGIAIRFATTHGTITPFASTNSSGHAVGELTSVASTVDQTAVVTASIGGATTADSLSQATAVTFKGVNFSLSVRPTTLLADGRSTARVIAILKEITSTVAVPNAPVIFGTDLGTIPHSVSTDQSGVAVAELTSGLQKGVATVIGIFGNELRDTVRVTFGESVPTYLNLTAVPAVLIADNRSVATLRAEVSDAANNPIGDGTHVAFEIAAGSGTIDASAETQNGVATSRLVSGTRPDTVIVRASVGALQDSVTVHYVVGAVADIRVVADSASLPADGITTTRVRAFVRDAVGNPVKDGTLISFSTNVGDITPSDETENGIAEAQFSSNVTGIATLRAENNDAGRIEGYTTLRLRPGPPNSILLSYDPTSVGVKDSGRNQTLTVTATVVDSKNNPVEDKTFVRFDIFASPGGGEFLSTSLPVPTVNGKAHVSLNSGIRSGTVRIRARVTDENGVPITPEVRAVSTEIIIFAGPPYIEDVNDRLTSHLSVGARPLNILGWHHVNSISDIVAVVGDKFNNPVPPGTAVYFTTTGGVISTHTGYTDDHGLAFVTLHSAQPYPDITRFYNTFFDPNLRHPRFSLATVIIPGPIPDFEGSIVSNSIHPDSTRENDGIARVLAVTEGVDAEGNSARPWSVGNVVFSGVIGNFSVTTDRTTLLPGEAATITIRLWDVNGNPVVPGSTLAAESQAGALSWSSLITDDPGTTTFTLLLTNDLDPGNLDAHETSTSVTIRIQSANGNDLRIVGPIQLKLK